MLAALRPVTPIIAATEHPRVAGVLTLLRGVRTVITGERDIVQLERLLIDHRLVPAASTAVFVS
jgi:hypothetical protein